MSDTTDFDVTYLQNEEATRTFMHLVTPLIQAAVSAAIPSELTETVNELRQARGELQSARDELKTATEKYVTADEARKIGQDIGAEIREPLSQSIDKHLKELSDEDERRNQAFDQRIGEVNALGLKNEQHLSTMEAVHEERLKKIEDRLTNVESNIKTGVAAVARHASTIDRTVTRWLDENTRKEEKYDLELKSLQIAKVQFEKEIRENREDTGNLRGDVDGLRGDIGATIRPMQESVRELKPRVSNLEARSTQTELVLDKIEWVVDGVRWLFKDRRGNTLLALIIAALVGFQIYYAVLSYQMNQSYQQLIAFLGH